MGEMDDESLKSLFGEYGTVTWSRVMPNKGKPTAAAIVEFSTHEEAKWVVENLNGNIAQGLEQPINVSFKRSNKGGGKGGGYGKMDGGGKGGWGGPYGGKGGGG